MAVIWWWYAIACLLDGKPPLVSFDQGGFTDPSDSFVVRPKLESRVSVYWTLSIRNEGGTLQPIGH